VCRLLPDSANQTNHSPTGRIPRQLQSTDPTRRRATSALTLVSGIMLRYRLGLLTELRRAGSRTAIRTCSFMALLTKNDRIRQFIGPGSNLVMDL